MKEPNPGGKAAAAWIDISLSLGPDTVVWPGQAPMDIKPVAAIGCGDVFNLSRLAMLSHAGTHMDAPCHYLAGRDSIDKMPLDAGIGPARVIAVTDPVSIKKGFLQEQSIQRGERLLFKTRNSDFVRRKEFDKGYVYLEEEAAHYLVECGIRLLGTDYVSVASYFDHLGTHLALLGGGIWIVEALDLGTVPPGNYELVCLPLKIAGCDGAPARAILWPL